MDSASPRYASTPDRASRRRRAAAFLLALVVHGLLIFMLLKLAPTPPRKPEVERRLITFQMLPQRRGTTQDAQEGAKKSKEASGGAAPRAPAPPAPPAAKPEAVPPPPPLPMVILSKEAFAASDISKLRSRPGGSGPGGVGAGVSAGSGAYGPGEGPGGVQLYDADWFRRPTDAELAFYMPKNAPRTGYGLVACQTVEDRRVDNCRELGESPRGSGLARAVRLAAWQFLIVPPRAGGRPMIGAWVRIRIDYTEGVVKE